MLVEQVLHERAAFLERDNDAHAEQLRAGRPPAAAEHLHGDNPFLDAALRHQAQQAALAAVVAVGGSGHDRDRVEIHSSVIGRSPLSSSASSWPAVRLKLCQYTPGRSLRPFSLITQCSYTAPARALRLDHGRFGAKVDYVVFRLAMGFAPVCQVVEVGERVGRSAGHSGMSLGHPRRGGGVGGGASGVAIGSRSSSPAMMISAVVFGPKRHRHRL
jgi:hypothetical protein